MNVCRMFGRSSSSKSFLTFLISFTFVSMIYYFSRVNELQNITKQVIDNVPSVHVNETDCDKLFKNDPETLSKAKMYQDHNPYIQVHDEAFIKQASNCEQFRKDRQYITHPLSKEEEEFPIAYSILIYKNVEQTERLLRAIYHPQNYYCIHVDAKANNTVKQAMKAIANCFENVFIASHLFAVYWGEYTVVEADLICMKDLLKYKRWKYFINLTGQEFPLKTNWEIVRILKGYNGSNGVAGTYEWGKMLSRIKYVHKGLVRTKELKDPPPVKLNFTKGAVHISASYDFVDFVINDQRAKEFWEWTKDTGHPCEHYFNSLNSSPGLGVPGAYVEDPDNHSQPIPFLTRFKNWENHRWPCAGKYVRHICWFGVGDLPLLQMRPEMFANKFDAGYEPLAYKCLEEWHFSKLKSEIQGNRDYTPISLDQYRNITNPFLNTENINS